MTVQDIGFVMQALQIPFALLFGMWMGNKGFEVFEAVLMAVLVNITWGFAAYQMVHAGGVA